MKKCGNLMKHLNAFNRVICEISNVEVKLEDKDKALLLLTLLSSSFKHFITILLYGKKYNQIR